MSPAARRAVPARRLRGDDGTTLIEVLVSIVILGLAGASILGGLLAAVRGSDAHHKQTMVEATIVSAAERLKDPSVARAPCATPTEATYLAAVRSGFVPPGWSAASSIQITSVRYSNGPSFGSTCYDTDALGHFLTAQLVTVQVTSPDGRARQSVSVVKGTNS